MVCPINRSLFPYSNSALVPYNALVLDVPAAAECLTDFCGVSPDVFLAFKPWGHVDHVGVEYGCRSSDQIGAYAHALDHPTSICAPTVLLSGDMLPDGNTTGAPGLASYDGVPSVHPGSVPFVSDRASAYGQLLLATHERMRTGGLVACDWPTPVMRRVALPISVVKLTRLHRLRAVRVDCWIN